MSSRPGTAEALRVVCRRADIADVDAVLSVVADDQAGYRARFSAASANVEELIETSFLSVTAVAVNPHAQPADEPPPVVGFASFSDMPVAGDFTSHVSAEDWMEWASSSLDLGGATLPSTAWLSLLVTDDRAGYGPDVVDSVLRTTFTTLPDIDCVVCLVPSSVGLFEPLSSSGTFDVAPVVNASTFESLDPTGLFRSTSVLVCPRERLIPTLRLRRAAVEDHDDLVPIFNSQSEVLTDQYGEFFLAELIEAQDDVHKALVAEVDGAAVGLMTVSSRVDVALLTRCFDLSMYNNLVKRSPAEAAAAARVRRAAVRTRRDWLSQIESHGSELTGVLDGLVADTEDIHADIPVPALRHALDLKGIMWGFENMGGVMDGGVVPAAGLGLGTLSLTELGISGDTVTRAQFNAALDEYSAARYRNARGLRLGAWYTASPVRQMVLEELEVALHEAAVAAADTEPVEQEGKEGGDADVDDAGGKEGEDDGSVAETPSALTASVTVETLAAAITDRVAQDGGRYVSEGGMTIGDDFLDELVTLMGPAWAAPAPESKLEADDDAAEGEEGTEVVAAPAAPEATTALDRAKLEAGLEAWEAAMRAYANVRILVTGNPKSGKRTLADNLSGALGLPVVDGCAVLAQAAADAAARAAEAAEAEARRKELAEEVGEEYEPPSPSEAKAEDSGRFGGEFAPLLNRLDDEDCRAGFILVNLPAEPDQQHVLSSDLAAASFAPSIELRTIATPGLAITRAGAEEAYTAAAAEYKRINNVRSLFKPAPPQWVPPTAVVEISGDAAPAAVAEAALDVLHRRRVVVDSQAEADEEAALDALEAGGDAVSSAASSAPNAFAVTLFCVDEMFESRSHDFLHHVFATFSDREYCVLTLPHVCPETALLSKFTLATPAPDSTFEHVLYVAHRAALLAPSEMLVRRAAPTDRTAVLELVKDLPAGPSIMAAVAAAEDHLGTNLEASPPTAALVATMAGQVVGVTVLSAEDASPSHLAAVREAFEVDMYLSATVLTGAASKYGSKAPLPVSTFLSHFAVNPIFLPFSRDVLRHALRLYGARHTVLYRQLPEETAVGVAPTVLDDLVQVVPRRLAELRPGERPVLFAADGAATQLSKDQLAELQLARQGQPNNAGVFGDPACDPRSLDHALLFLTRRLCSEPKLRVNARVVIVGASDTSLAFLQAILFVPYLQFTNVTLVSPGGLPPCEEAGDGAPAPFLPRADYSAFDLARLALHSTIRVADAAVVAIDRDAKTVGLTDGSVVPYDTLVLGAGLTEPTRGRLGYVHDGEGPPNLIGLSHHGVVPALNSAASRLAVGGGGGAPAGGVRDVLVYGDALEALTALHALMDRGIAGGRITFAHPGPADAVACVQDVEGGIVTARVLAALEAAEVEVIGGATLKAAEEAASGDVAVGLAVDGGDDLRAAYALVVCGDRRNVDLRFFGAVNDAGLAYDGRLVINHGFLTTDDSIFACGTVTKFSRRYKAPKWLQAYNSKEMGTAVANAVLAKLDPLRAASASVNVSSAPGMGADTFPQRSGPSTLPRFTAPRRAAGVLPGGLQYVHVEQAQFDVGKSGAPLLTQSPPPAEGATFSTGERTFQVVLDKYGWMASLLYVGEDEVEVENLTALVGRHESQLNALARDFAAGRVADLADFFRGDWCTAIFHDRFAVLGEDVREVLTEDGFVDGLLGHMTDMVQKEAGDKALARKRLEAVGQAGAALPPSTRRAVELKVIEHLRLHGALLPAYYIPGSNVGGV